MIGYLEKPTGRMGNVLIQYIFLRQIAKRAGVDYYHVELPYSDRMENFSKHNVTLSLLLRKKWKVTMSDIEKIGVSQFVNKVRELDEKGINTVLAPPMLGHLLDFTDDNPGQYVEIREKYKVEIENAQRKKIVGIHFRGTDFKMWDEHAVLSGKYYIDAIEYVVNVEKKEEIKVCLFTDDNECSAYREVEQYLSQNGYDYIQGNEKNEMMVDFYQLSQCDYIISSPSTYAIMASLIGKRNKRVIHSKEWIEYCVEKKEHFWGLVVQNENPYYQLFALI